MRVDTVQYVRAEGRGRGKGEGRVEQSMGTEYGAGIVHDAFNWGMLVLLYYTCTPTSSYLLICRPWVSKQALELDPQQSSRVFRVDIGSLFWK